MRKIAFTLLLLAFLSKGICQDSIRTNEFANNKNGLIYSEQDINALRFVVDSLNLRFKSCDLKKYYAYPQAKAYSLKFSSKTDDLQQIISSLKNGVSFQSLLKTYKNLISKADSNVFLVSLPDRENGKLRYLSGNAFNGFDDEYRLSGDNTFGTKKWIFEYFKKEKYHEIYSLDALYITEDLLQPVIPNDYAKLIQYIDCMVDTAEKIFTSEKYIPEFLSNDKKNIAYTELNNFLNARMKIKKSKNDYDYSYLTDSKIKFVIDSLNKNTFVINKLNELATWYTTNGGGDDGAEEMIAALISKQRALQLKRNRRVMGSCSMDESPRRHAWNIAMLAAETHSWEIFLRAHLDIMNDRFDRMTDGSYAWGQRQTYIKELETLDINVIDMMLGLSLRAYNISPGHYNGTVWRIGRALSESKDRLLFEKEAKKIMQDDKLDQFNRSLIFLLYRTYLNYLEDKKEAQSKIEILKNEIVQYPSFIQTAIKEIKFKSMD